MNESAKIYQAKKVSLPLTFKYFLLKLDISNRMTIFQESSTLKSRIHKKKKNYPRNKFFFPFKNQIRTDL